MERKKFKDFYTGTICVIANGICDENAGLVFSTDNFDGLFEEYLNQKALLKLLLKNTDDPDIPLLDRHKIAACVTVAIMKKRLLYPENIDDANNSYSLLEASRMNEQLAFLSGLNILIFFLMEDYPEFKESLKDFIFPKTRYEDKSTYLDSIIRALYYSNTISGFHILLLSNIFFLLEEYHKSSCLPNDKNYSKI